MSKAPRIYTEFEREYALMLLDACKGDLAEAAKRGNINKKDLQYWAEGGAEIHITEEVLQGTTETPEQPGQEEDDCLERPYPSLELSMLHRSPLLFAPSHQLTTWIENVYLSPSGPLYNEDHWYLKDAKIGCMWTNSEFGRGERKVAGMAERVSKLGNKWQTAQYHYHLTQWFGEVPDFVLRFDAPISAELHDRGFCGLVDHELYHCTIALDDEGAPRMNQDDEFLWITRPHDAEEFDRIVERYGCDLPTGGSASLIAASKRRRQITDEMIAEACGTGKYNPWK